MFSEMFNLHSGCRMCSSLWSLRRFHRLTMFWLQNTFIGVIFETFAEVLNLHSDCRMCSLLWSLRSLLDTFNLNSGCRMCSSLWSLRCFQTCSNYLLVAECVYRCDHWDIRGDPSAVPADVGLKGRRCRVWRLPGNLVLSPGLHEVSWKNKAHCPLAEWNRNDAHCWCT